MKRSWRGRVAGLLAWGLVASAGAVWLAQARLGQLQAGFETDARIVHRLLSQRVVQHDAIMSTLALLPVPASAEAVAQRLSAAYPQILGVRLRADAGPWPADNVDQQAALKQAEAASRQSGHAALAAADLPQGRYALVMAGSPASYALDIDLRASVPWDEWPMVPASSPVRVTLTHEGQAFLVQPGRSGVRGWRYEFHKVLAAPSQPFEVVAERVVGWRELPWLAMLGWCLLTAAVWLVSLAGWRQGIARRRAEELLRLGQAARLNTLGELAAGMAHELNQPLTALLASTQAAQRLLTEAPPDLDTARTALQRAVEQARRASAVVGRLRRLVERPDIASQTQPVSLLAAVHDAIHLLESELSKRGITPEVQAAANLPEVQAEPVALQQIIHNLLMNALQALEQVPNAQRKLVLRLQPQGQQQVLLAVRDHGPGMDAAARRRVFEPFYSTRPGGLGLGLSLCESLAESMGATLTLAPPAGPGAELLLVLLAAQAVPEAGGPSSATPVELKPARSHQADSKAAP